MTLRSRLSSTLALWVCLFAGPGVSGCATSTMGTSASGKPLAGSSADVSDDGRLFADFLAGTYASNVGDFDARARYYSRAYARAPDDLYLGRRALSFALLDGDIDSARAIATSLNRAVDGEPMARLVLGERAMVRGRHAEAERYFRPDSNDFGMSIAAEILQGWNHVAAGDAAEARDVFDDLESRTGIQRFTLLVQSLDALGNLQIAKLDAGDGDYDAALSRLDAVKDAGFYPTDVASLRARVLTAKGDLDGAIEGLREARGIAETGTLVDLEDDLRDGDTKLEIDWREGAADALLGPALSFYIPGGALDQAEVYLRLARDLDPDSDLARVVLASVLSATERDADALALLREVDTDSEFVVSARLAEANILFQREDDATALDVLETIAAAKPSVVTREALGRARLIREAYAEAYPIYDALVRSLDDDRLRADPNPLFFRGVSLAETDRFDQAVLDFQRLLELDPDNSQALNYLGYSWVDRGENLTEAFALIERAVELEPDSGAIVDSLGWAHYKLGNYSEARIHLERATELSPASATIVDHLGDVYWKLGRRREARFQWERALTLDPSDTERAAITAKLAGQAGPS